ncbi:hypothetical protein OSB04_011420 [Centaurea solstitialis]|uniref:Uncharacterized protein n=1 Tax=Centaurea solstitialis TaxID=347529 RepID=A0AA38WQ28_9ASTR|nr:hypothetical protein OSB04_011420 [Centaurea solstitialis]
MAATTSTSLDAQLSSEATPLQATESLPIIIPQHDVQFKQNNVVGLFDIPADKEYLLPAKEFLLNSPLKTAFTLDPKPNKPMLQQLWSTATVAKEKNTKGVLREVIKFQIKENIISFGFGTLRNVLNFPKKKRFPPVPSADEIIEFLDAIGYRWPVNKEGVMLPKTGATVHKSGLNATFYYIWNTFGLCLSGKMGSTEQFPTVIQHMVFSAIKNREFDYARSIWDDMVKKVRSKNRVVNIAFPRFFSAILELHLGDNYPKIGNSNNYSLGPRFLDQVAHHPDDVPLSDVLVVPEPLQDQDAEQSTSPTAAATTTSVLQKRPQPSSATPPPPPKRAKSKAQKKKKQAADTPISAPVTQEPEVVQLEPSENEGGNRSDTLLASGSLGAGSEGHLHQDDPFNDFVLTDAEHQLNTAELRRQSAERNLQEARTALQQKEEEHSARLQTLQQELVAAKAAAAAAEAAAASATAAAIAATPPPTAVTLSIPCLDNIHDKVSQVASSSTNLQASIDDLKATALPALSKEINNSTNSLTTFQSTVVQRLDAQEAALRAIQEQVTGLSSAVNALTSAPAPPPSFTTADREVLQSLISSSFIQRKVLSDMASLLQRSVSTTALVQAPVEGERQPRDHSAYSPSTNWRTTEDGGNNEDDDDDDEDDDDDIDDDIFVEKVPASAPIPGLAQPQGENPDASGMSLLPSSPSSSDNQPISVLLKTKPTPETITLDTSPEDSPPNNLQMVIYQPPKLPSPEPSPTSHTEPEPNTQAYPEDVNYGSVTGDIIRLMENSPNEQTRAELSRMTFRITPLNQETISTRPATRFNQEASSSRTPEIRATPETICLSSDDEFISDDFSTPASSPRSPPSNSPRSEGENYPDNSFAIDRDGRLDAVIERLESTRVKIPLRTSCDSEFAYLSQEEYNEAVQAQLEHNKKQKEAFLSAQAARRLASDFVDEDAEISADPILAQKAVLKVFNKNAEIQTGEVNAELDWCRDRLHLRKHGAAISGIHLRRSRGKKGNPGKTWITVKRSGVKDVEHTLDKLDRYNLSEWNEIRSLLPKANKNYRAEVEEVIEGLIARIRRTTEIPDDLLHYSSVLSQQPVRRSAGSSTRRPTPCLPRMVVKPLDLSMLDLSFPPGISLSEGQVIREPVHGICVSDNSKMLRFQRFSELHIAPYEHLLTVLFTAQQDKKNPDNKEIIRTVRAILDHRLAFSDTPVPVCVKTEYISEESDRKITKGKGGLSKSLITKLKNSPKETLSPQHENEINHEDDDVVYLGDDENVSLMPSSQHLVSRRNLRPRVLKVTSAKEEVSYEDKATKAGPSTSSFRVQKRKATLAAKNQKKRKMKMIAIEEEEDEVVQMVLELPAGDLEITKDTVKQILGFPTGEIDISQKKTSTGEMFRYWRSQFPQSKKEIHASLIVEHMKQQTDGGVMFKLNFFVLVATCLCEAMKAGTVNQRLLHCIENEDDIDNLDWCALVIDSLKRSKNNWDRTDPGSYYCRALLFLMMDCYAMIWLLKELVRLSRFGLRTSKSETVVGNESERFGHGILQEPCEDEAIPNEEDEYEYEERKRRRREKAPEKRSSYHMMVFLLKLYVKIQFYMDYCKEMHGKNKYHSQSMYDLMEEGLTTFPKDDDMNALSGELEQMFIKLCSTRETDVHTKTNIQLEKEAEREVGTGEVQPKVQFDSGVEPVSTSTLNINVKSPIHMKEAVGDDFEKLLESPKIASQEDREIEAKGKKACVDGVAKGKGKEAKREPKLVEVLLSPYRVRHVELERDITRHEKLVAENLFSTRKPPTLLQWKTITLPLPDRQEEFDANILVACQENADLASLRADLVFFPILRSRRSLSVSHFYLVVFNFKNPSFIIIDSIKHEGSIKEVYGIVPETLKLKDWKCGLEKGGAKNKAQEKQLIDLRKKYAAKILLSPLNTKKDNVDDEVKEWQRFDAKEQKWHLDKPREELLSRFC